MKGTFGKILVINLREQTYREEAIPDEVYEHYLGGKGLGIYLLSKMNPAGVDPLSPDNHFIFNLGPATDTKVWGSSRYGVTTKSPLTGIYAEGYSGGRVAEPMSRTGYDAVVLEAASKSPVFVEIGNDGVRFHDAGDIWGKDTYEAEEAISAKINRKQAGVLVIGPAGENLVRLSSIVNNKWRCAGRAGVGAVLGSKKVKGIVFYGNQSRESGNPEGIQKLYSEWLKKSKGLPATTFFKKMGTPGLVSIVNNVEAFPSRYWYDGTLEDWQKISAEMLNERFRVKARSCNRCFLACGRYTEVLEGRHKGLIIDGPEFETIYAFGGLCMIKDLGEIIYLNDLCDRLGLDTITAGNLAAFTIEASRRGRVDRKIEYGDADGVARLITDIAMRKDVGAVLADGIVPTAREWNLEDIAIHVKGMEPAGYDPRFFKAMALAYATSDRGACHMRTTAFRPELAGMIPPDQIEGKAEIVIDFEDRLTLQDSLILCRFYRDVYLWEEMGEIVEATTGRKMDKAGLRQISSNIRDAVRNFNLREGMTGQADTLPRRFLSEPLGSKRVTLTEEQLNRMISDYYRIRGWNEKGEPIRKLPLGL